MSPAALTGATGNDDAETEQRHHLMGIPRLGAGRDLVCVEERLRLDQTAQHVNRYTGKGRVIDVQRQAHDLTPRGEFQRGFNRLEQSSIGLGIKKGPALDVQCRHTFLGQQQPHLSIAKIKPSGHPCTDP